MISMLFHSKFSCTWTNTILFLVRMHFSIDLWIVCIDRSTCMLKNHKLNEKDYKIIYFTDELHMKVVKAGKVVVIVG